MYVQGKIYEKIKNIQYKDSTYYSYDSYDTKIYYIQGECLFIRRPIIRFKIYTRVVVSKKHNCIKTYLRCLAERTPSLRGRCSVGTCRQGQPNQTKAWLLSRRR